MTEDQLNTAHKALTVAALVVAVASAVVRYQRDKDK